MPFLDSLEVSAGHLERDKEVKRVHPADLAALRAEHRGGLV